MTRDEIIRMAREAGFETAQDWALFPSGFVVVVERFAALVAAAEREACAKVCEMEAVASSLGHKTKAVWQSEVAGKCAAAIRARGNV